jgi:hypothetical protein
MLVTLGWLLVAGLPFPRTIPIHDAPATALAPAAGRVTVWTDRDEPYAQGDGMRVYLSVDAPSYVAVFRVDTDGRIRVLLPQEPWTDTYLHDRREVEVGGPRGGRAFVVDDDPGMGYLFAIAAAEPLDFRDITRGDYWDYRLVDGGRIQGDPYVALTDLAARIAPDGDYDYDIAPYYVEHRYDYPRFVCYDCHAHASYQEWNPYSQSCPRYRVVIRDDPRYYPYRYGGRNVVASRPAHPGPRYVFRDADPGRPAVVREQSEPRPGGDDFDRTSEDVGGRGVVPAPGLSAWRRRQPAAESHVAPVRPLTDRQRQAERDQAEGRPQRDGERDDSAREGLSGRRPATRSPQSTGEPELRRRRP